MEWISSAGGPLVLVPEELVHLWRGVAGGIDGTDYDKACAVDDYVGLVEWNGCEVLVLGDEPLRTGTWTGRDKLTLVRWMYAPDESAVIDCLNSNAWGPPVESMDWEAKKDSHVLFDSGASGELLTEKLTVELSSGRYTVNTYVVKPNGELGLVLHVFDARSK